jgi:CBS domain-containing protein
MSKTIHDVMHSGVETHGPDAPLTAIAKTMRDKDVGAVPIIDKGQVVGLVTDRDITVRALADGRDPAKLTAKDLMTRDVACCQEGDSAESAAKLMQTKRIRRLPVIGKDKKLVGMVSLGDISHALPKNIAGEVMQAVSAHHV